MLHKDGFRHHGTRAAGAGQPGDRRQQMQKKDGQIAHRAILARSRHAREMLTNLGTRHAQGVYWIPIYEILKERGVNVQLVIARHVKNVPGRKIDVSDCEWLRELHSVGLLRGSFRPTDAIAGLRA